jgi:DNA-binding transcriptional MerR regulator
VESQTITVSEAAKELGISPSTLRRWYDDFLAAESGSVQERRLSADDMAKLAEVARFKREGLSKVAIQRELASLVIPAPAPPEPSTALQEASSEVTGALVVVEALRSMEARMQALEARLQPVEAQHLRFDAVWLVVAAFVAGLIVGLSVWWFQ